MNDPRKNAPTATKEEETMTDDRTHTPAAHQPEEGRDVSTLLPMLVGGLVLITLGMIAIAIAV